MSMYRSPDRKISKKQRGHGPIWVSLRAAVGDHQHNQPKRLVMTQNGSPQGKHTSGGDCRCGKCYAINVLGILEAPAKTVKCGVRERNH